MMWRRQPKHQHTWTVIAEHFTEPGGEIGPLKLNGRSDVVDAALREHYKTLEHIRLGTTTLVYACVCGVRRTDQLVGDARRG